MGQKFVSISDAVTGMRGRVFRKITGTQVPDAREMKQRLTASYQPMLVVLLFPAAAYFALMTAIYFTVESPEGFLLLGGISSLTSVACIAIRRNISRRALTFGELELRGVVLFILVYAGLVAEQMYRFQPEKLTLFMFLMLVTATASVSVRIAAAVVAICTATAFVFATEAEAGRQLDVLLVAFASSLVAFSMTVLTRLAIIKEICARMTSEKLQRGAEFVANHDTLTGLPNRRTFLKALEARFEKRKGAIPAFAVAVVDLDGFKAMNDSFGPAVGDAVLTEASHRMTETCREARLIARIGGDKFGVLVDGPLDNAALEGFGTRIRAALAEPITIMGIRLAANSTVGIVPEQINIFTGSEMMERADFAINRARAGRHGVIVFTPELEKDRRNNCAVEHNLRHCDREKEMYVVFQPQIDIETGRTSGFEALARWNNPELGPVFPDMFIRAAERIGVIEDLTALYLAKALDAARDWPDSLKLSFNLSIRDILSPCSMGNVCRIVKESGFPPERIEFEVTENLIISDFEQADESVAMLHGLGARVALDDFGVGYANFGHIDRLAINTIKIDRSFVIRLADSGSTVKVMKAMIDMCANLEVDCVVEGVETEQELAILRQIGARFLQGYHFSRPMEPDAIPAYLARELAGSVSAPPAPATMAG